jgi:CDP-glucose 4,6-dehydratase
MEAAVRANVARVVVASSASAYGPCARSPHTEDMELAPTNAYDISKAAMDLSSRAYHATHGLPVATARLSNVYGAGDRNTTRLIPELIAAALDGRAPRIRSDGSPSRGFLHLDDAVDAYLAIADALDDPTGGARGAAFNAGWPEPIAVRDVVATLEDIVGRPLHALYETRDGTGTPSCSYVSNAKLTAATGWTPRIGLDEGLRRTVEWYAAARAAATAA